VKVTFIPVPVHVQGADNKQMLVLNNAALPEMVQVPQQAPCDIKPVLTAPTNQQQHNRITLGKSHENRFIQVILFQAIFTSNRIPMTRRNGSSRTGLLNHRRRCRPLRSTI
jgi:hypothetical protein